MLANGDNMSFECLLLLQEKQPFERIEVSREQALEMFDENKFKVSGSAFYLNALRILISLSLSLFIPFIYIFFPLYFQFCMISFLEY